MKYEYKPVEVLISTLLPLYVWFRLSEEYFGFPAFSFILAAKRSDILDRQSWRKSERKA